MAFYFYVYFFKFSNALFIFKTTWVKYYKKIASCTFFSKPPLCAHLNILWGNAIIDVCKLLVFHYAGLESLIDFHLLSISHEIVTESDLRFTRKRNEGQSIKKI